MSTASSSISSSRKKLYAALESEQGSAYVLGVDLSIQYVNEGWRRFALQNGAPELATVACIGRLVTDFFDPGLRAVFGARLRRAIEQNEAWSHSYECSSPDLYREFNMRAAPTLQSDGLFVIHSLVVEVRLGDNEMKARDHAELYTDARGLIVQCSGCGRIHQPPAGTWHWVPGLVDSERENISHGMCTTCDFHYYGYSDGAIPLR